MVNERIAAPVPAMRGRVEEIACDVLWPCTRSPIQVCQVLSNLAAHNRVLWHLGLHLREDPRDNVGELSVVQAQGFNAESQRNASDERAESFAITVLRHLFEQHRCIVAAEVNHVVAKTDSLLGSLATAPCLRRLTVAKIPGCEPILEIDSWVMTTFNITGKRAILSHSDTSSIGAALNAVGILLQRTDNALRTLDLAALEITGHALRRRIILALCKNRTIAELAVPHSVIACESIAPRSSAKPFALYLAREDATLRKLTIGSRGSCTATTFRLNSLIPAIWRMSTLEELSIVVHFNMCEYEQFAEVVANSQSLRSFVLRCCQCCRCCKKWALRLNVLLADTYQTPHPLASALRVARSLRKITIDLSWNRSGQCVDIIRAITQSTGIEDVTLLNITPQYELEAICRLIRKFRAPWRVCVDAFNVAPSALETIRNCREVNNVVLSAHTYWQVLNVAASIRALVTCDHVTSLRLTVHYFNEEVYDEIKYYARFASNVRDLQVSLLLAPFHEADPRRLEAEAAIVEALSTNHHVTKLTLTTGPLREQHYRRLADRVLENLGLRELSITVMNDSFCDVFLDRLLPGLRYNYNIVRLQLEQSGGTFSDAMATAQNIVRRNCSIERRAVQFVMGVHDPYCARVVEIAAERLGFVEAVRREAVVTKTEAAEKLKEALSIVRLADVHEFMRFAGVVRCWVRRDAADQSMHLSDLPYDCWQHVRRYVKLTDVLTDV